IGKLRFHLEYLDPNSGQSSWPTIGSNNWPGVEYDTQDVDLSRLLDLPSDGLGVGATPAPVSPAVPGMSASHVIEGMLWEETSNGYYYQPNASVSGTGTKFDEWGRWGAGTRVDPRTRRFGMAY